MHFSDVVADHLLRHRCVRDDAVAERSNGNDVRWGSAEHALRFSANGDHLARLRLNGNHRGLADDDPLPMHMDERVRRAEVDPNIVGEEAVDAVEH